MLTIIDHSKDSQNSKSVMIIESNPTKIRFQDEGKINTERKKKWWINRFEYKKINGNKKSTCWVKRKLQVIPEKVNKKNVACLALVQKGGVRMDLQSIQLIIIWYLWCQRERERELGWGGVVSEGEREGHRDRQTDNDDSTQVWLVIVLLKLLLLFSCRRKDTWYHVCQSMIRLLWRPGEKALEQTER